MKIKICKINQTVKIGIKLRRVIVRATHFKRDQAQKDLKL